MTRKIHQRLAIVGGGVVLAVGILASQLSSIGARLILHPPRKRAAAAPPPTCEKAAFIGKGVNLQGWRGEAFGRRRGTMIYLHGVADNRVSGAGVMKRFQKRGFDVLAYDSRAHGESGGDACTYGFFEKEDLRHVLDGASPGPIVLIGSSLGAAVALQLAPTESRISAVIAAEAFSDLRTAVTERAPFFFRSETIERALNIAEQKGLFTIDAVSPASAAQGIIAPTLIVHGAADSDTPPDHARRIFAALSGPKRLILVPGAKHNGSLRGDDVWKEIEGWIDTIIDPLRAERAP